MHKQSKPRNLSYPSQNHDRGGPVFVYNTKIIIWFSLSLHLVTHFHKQDTLISYVVPRPGLLLHFDDAEV